MKLQEVQAELQRLNAGAVSVRLDDEFEPDAGELVEIELEGAYWHMLPDHFVEMLKELPSGAGGEAVRETIERKGEFVWHGPSPKDSRDTSH